ncbi:helix-turn-helix transcriptional regulator [Streptomyces phaeolivaceus]|uniref:Helix-turn-helix transcriptional regulator n=1 Tax=Streptomyces phaeolivaceus TaxID=2653200 RepID=A0A5P8KBW2_9ACTN|nr:helix-turn-helix transcriptional regulator [Streptomyces phaeolivaceus]
MDLDEPRCVASLCFVGYRQVMRVDGPRIRRRRELSGHGLRAFADSVGISASYLSRIERGQRAPQPEVLAAIAGRLQCPIEELEQRSRNERGEHELALHDDQGTRGPRP